MPSSMRFGVLGMGQYGKKINSKLEQMGVVTWAVNSNSDYTVLEIPDWVFIATPNFLHYEQAEFFIRCGANVFVEKPATLNPAALEYLINLSKLNDCLFYVDDVFLHRSDFNLANLGELGNRFGWHKSTSAESGSLLDRLVYHHLYLLFEAFNGNLDFEIISGAYSMPDKLDFDANINKQKYSFSYSATDGGKDINTVFGKSIGQAPNDALSDMLSAVLNKTISFDKNHIRALWVTNRISEIRKAIYKNVSIIGGGIFGSTIAIELANQGFNVVLYERHENLLEEASSINQYRVHEGYHYPRSIETAVECKASVTDFIKYYKQSIIPKSAGIINYYAIASKSSMTEAEEYITFMDKVRLPYIKVKPLQGTDLMVEVEESIFDPAILASCVNKRIFGAGVELRLGWEATEKDLLDADFTIVATYANLNDWRVDKREYQYEICEKPVLRLPDSYHKKSIVVMDGPFMCIDPLGSSDLHVMGNVVHAIHNSNIGHKPIIPDGYENLINKGLIKNPSITKINKFIESALNFFPDIDKAQHIGSMFTIRTVLPYKENDDARPTLVEWIGNNRLLVFSGKICTCVSASKTVLKCIQDQISTDVSYSKKIVR